jgi:acyl-CoA synthetase (AMP-forming)/AMP-acid ligase II
LKPGEDATPEDILAFCKDRRAGHQKPRSIVFVEDFPLSPVGKVLRQKIRDKYGK